MKYLLLTASLVLFTACGSNNSPDVPPGPPGPYTEPGITRTCSVPREGGPEVCICTSGTEATLCQD